MQLGSGTAVAVAVAVAQAGGYSSDQTPILGTSIYCECGPRKGKKTTKKKKKKEKERKRERKEKKKKKKNIKAPCDDCPELGNHYERFRGAEPEM